MCRQKLSLRPHIRSRIHARIRAIAVGLMSIMLAFSITAPTQAAGLLVANGPFGGALDIKEQNVDVTINNGIVVTQVEQIFVNKEDRIVEALYTFPVPKGASVANFSMWINGKEMIGEVVEKKRAREIYETYKQQPRPRDPGLLEQVDYKTFEMRIFPIAARAEQRVRVTYYQELDVDHDWSTYVYPLATVTQPNINQRTTGKMSLTLHARSEIPIKSLTSPSHKDDFVVVRHSAKYWQASLEATGGDLSRDFVMAINATRPQTGVDILTTKQSGEDGYMQLTITAGEELEGDVQPMDFVFLLDVSGSMASDGKILVSRKQLEAFTQTLSPKDRFDVLAFNVSPTALFNKATEASEDNIARATKFLNSVKVRGGTELQPALSAAYRYKQDGRMLNVILLSDGMTEQATRQGLIQQIQQRPNGTRVFCIGVGNEVNRPLLRQIAQDSGGLASFLSRGDDFDRQAKAFRRKLDKPVASDLSIAFEGLDVYDIEPQKLPDLFHGTPVRIYARYRNGGNVKITVLGNVKGQPIEQSRTIELPVEEAKNPEIERMWAWHRIDTMMQNVDAATTPNQSVIDEIVRLGEGYSITSQYTSFIVLENDGEYKRWAIKRRNALRIERDRSAQQQVRSELEALRKKSQLAVGPGAPVDATKIADAKSTNANSPATKSNSNNNTNSRPSSDQSNNGGQNWNFSGGGGGAISPLMGLLMLIIVGAVVFEGQRKAKAAGDIGSK